MGSGPCIPASYDDVYGPSSTSKRKAPSCEADGTYVVGEAQRGKRQKPSKKVIDLTGGDDDCCSPKKKKASKRTKGAEGEVRKRRYRAKAPQSYLEIRSRALTQPMFVIDRVRAGTSEIPEEVVQMAGSTGNIYTVTINQMPRCDCMHAKKGNQCKHIVFVLTKVLKAREGLQYQLAFLSSELRDIFSNAPPVPSASNASDGPATRKPLEGDCAICFDEFDPDNTTDTVWCRDQCGTNFHEVCMQTYIASKGGERVNCPFCRARWRVGGEGGDGVRKVMQDGEKNVEGYVNVAAQLGLSGKRDYSSYHPVWYHRQKALGLIRDEEYD